MNSSVSIGVNQWFYAGFEKVWQERESPASAE